LLSEDTVVLGKCYDKAAGVSNFQG
jgi:hypothetical protein